MESPVLKDYSWSWVVLRSPELEEEFLLSVGATGSSASVAQVKDRTDELYRVLLNAKCEGG